MSTRQRPRRARGDAGVTLIELLVSISISAVVIGAASMALIVGFKTSAATADSFGESNDAEMIAAYFVPDAQSATLVGQAITTGCSAQGPADVLRMQGPTFSVGYRLEAGVLTRWICESSTTSTRILARHLEDVIAWSTGGHQVAMTIVASSGHSFSLVGTQRTGTVDLPPPASPNVLPEAVPDVDCAHLHCVLDGGGSTDSDGAIASFAWDLGDGTTATTEDVDHLYAVAGTYLIRLTVTDTSGGTATATVSVTVLANQVPTASFTVSCVGRTCTADGAGSIDLDGAVSAFAWAWGDGTTNDSGNPVVHTYATVGAKTITLTVVDNDGAIAVTTRPVTATNQVPVASFTVLCTGRVCNVDASASTDADGTVNTYAWSWGDATANGSGRTAAHTYTTSGSKTITLTVTDNQAATGATTRTFNVNLAPTASFTIDNCNLAVCAVNASGSSDGDGTIASYAWNWGDAGTGTGSTASHLFTALGARTVVLTITDDDGATTTFSRVVTPPVLVFTTTSPTYSVTLTWLTASLSGNVDIYRVTTKLSANVVDTGTFVRSNTKANVNGTYKVCEAGLTRCTNTITVAIP